MGHTDCLRTAFLAVFITLAGTHTTRAHYELLPEFESLTEAEQAVLESPVLLGSRYQLDLIAYRKDPSWEKNWLSRSLGLDIDFGSLNGSQFLIDNRIKVHSFLNNHVQFRFTSYASRDLEQDSTHTILELVYWPSAWLGISAYGDPSLYKRENDTGVALILKPAPEHEIRIFNTFVDVTRQKRNNRNDAFIEPHIPYSRGLVGRIQYPDQEFLEYFFRQETHTRWNFPDDYYEYDYWKVTLGSYGHLKVSDRGWITQQIQIDRKLESRSPTSPQSTVIGEAVRRDRVRLTSQAEIERIGPYQDWSLRFGIDLARRTWEMNPGRALFQDIVPFVFLILPALSSDQWTVGLESSHHLQDGPRVLFSEDTPTDRWLGKLVISYDVYFADATLRLLASGNLNEYGKRGAWDGGAALFQLRKSI